MFHNTPIYIISFVGWKLTLFHPVIHKCLAMYQIMGSIDIAATNFNLVNDDVQQGVNTRG